MTTEDKEFHRKRHNELHSSFDELFADFISHGNGRLTSTIKDLIEWSFKQTIKPDHKDGGG